MTAAHDVERSGHVVLGDRYHVLPVKRVVSETDDAKSFVFDVPTELADRFVYRPGQFVTLRVVVAGRPEYRSYSMSSTPSIDTDLQVTVKRVPGGLVSNWLNDEVVEGHVLEVSTPAGAFVLDDTADDVVAFAGGSGVTPIFSIVKAALHHTNRDVRLLVANRDRQSAIFGDVLDELQASFPGRLLVEHHEDLVHGFVNADDVATFVGERREAACYVCGPAGFMDIVEAGLQRAGVPENRVHIERFTPASASGGTAEAPPPASTAPAAVTITVGAETKTIEQRGRSTILQSARWVGLRAPSSCEAGHCATCMARLVEGEVEMATNEVLTPEELDEGWVLTCQAVPVTSVVRVVYE